MTRSANPTPRHFAASTLVLLTALVCIAPATADDRGTLLQVRAERLANTGECAEAIALLGAAPEPARSSGELLRLKGGCQIELERYTAAIASLEAAKAADSGLANLDLMIGIARYQDEDFDGATVALDAARVGNTERQAELELYSGLVLLRAGKAREAALALERARRLDADAVEPVASYYAALAWHSERETDRAQAALERTRQNDPDGPWTKQATDALRTVGGEVPWWVVVGAGVEYDSNVILRATRDTHHFDEDDVRGVWSVSGGLRLLEAEKWSGGVISSYSGSGHFDHSDFDSHTPSVGAWLDRRFGADTLLRFRYDYAYAWIDNDPFVSRHQERVALLHDWGTPGTTELFVEGEHNNFMFNIDDWLDAPTNAACILAAAALPAALTTPCGVDGRNETLYRDRDGAGVSAGVEQRVPVGIANSTVRAGYRFTRYWADGAEWDYDRHRVHVGLSSLLPYDLLLDVESAYTYAPFQNASSFPIPPAFIGRLGTFRPGDRRDHVWDATSSLEKAITDEVIVSARYTYTDSNSNTEFFDYHRHIVGAYVTVRLP